jgi:NAD(P)-dependent dehydrogenase (short-subunit alcohol dehydrogenase family)
MLTHCRGRRQTCEAAVRKFSIACDVTHRDQVQEFVTDVQDTLGPIEVLVNNAGIIQSGPLECMTIDDFDRTMSTHFWGPLHTIEAVLPEMRRRRQGRIVNIASFGGLVAVPHLVPYCASKFALVGLSRGLRASLAGEGILVTTVCPGLMRTGSARNAEFKGRHRAEYAYFSISDSLPVVSIDARRAARQIVEGCRRGHAEVHPTLPAKLIGRLAALCPELSAYAMSLANSVLPSAGGIGTDSAPGHASESKWSPSWLTTLSDRAALENNEISLPRISA